MARLVRVTVAQKSAAKAVLSRSTKSGRDVSKSVTKIAEAKSRPHPHATKASA